MHRKLVFNWDRSTLRSKPRLERYVQESSPEAFLITCTDSVLDASLLAQLRSVPLLLWRSTGPVVPPFGTGNKEFEEALEAAIYTHGIQEIAICGHMPAESLRALINIDPNSVSPEEDACLYYIQATRRIVQEKYGRLESDQLVRAVAEENVFVQMANLKTHPAVMSASARGNLTLHCLIFDVDKDELFSHGGTEGRFLSRLKKLSGPPQTPPPCLDPREIYLA